VPIDWDTITAAELCENAAIDQGLGEFLSLDGWIVENTGGFTMVAYYYYQDKPANGKSALAVTTSDDYDDTYQVWLVVNVGNAAIDDILIRKSATLTDVKKLAYLLI
jgi:hypothetical protein